MKWIIDSKRFDMTDLLISIEFSPENKPLRYFLAGVDLIKYPKLLDSTYRRDSYYQPPMSLRFYNDLDWEDLKEISNLGGIKEDEVVVYHEVYGESVIKELLFCQILLDYSIKLLEVYKNDKTLSIKWNDEMLKEINQLRGKLENQV